MDPRAREMVDRQIVARGLTDRQVLDAMRDVPRELFVPESLRHEAYDDRPLPIGEGQTISQPYMVAIMTAELAPASTHRVLEIGTGSGYQTAILARLSARVISIERHAPLAARARDALAALGVDNVEVLVGDGSEGWQAQAPYDRILVTAGAPKVPETLEAQLADGGRLVVPVGPAAVQRLVVIDRAGSTFTSREGEACVFVPLVGRHGWIGP